MTNLESLLEKSPTRESSLRSTNIRNEWFSSVILQEKQKREKKQSKERLNG